MGDHVVPLHVLLSLAAFALDVARADDFFLLLAMERCSLDAAVADVKDGATILIGGFGAVGSAMRRRARATVAFAGSDW